MQEINGLFLELGKPYYIIDRVVKAVISDGTGCIRCTFERKCARFEAKSSLIKYHTLCGAAYRQDGNSVVLVEVKDVNKAPNLNDNE